jgi:hypothetical protein
MSHVRLNGEQDLPLEIGIASHCSARVLSLVEGGLTFIRRTGAHNPDPLAVLSGWSARQTEKD